MNNIQKNEQLILPDFSESDILCLKKYYEFNERYREQLNLDLRKELTKHPLWGPILKSMDPGQSLAQNERSLQLQRKAIYEGKWKEYSEDLLVRGKMYAFMNIKYNEWYELISLGKTILMTYIKRDLADSLNEAIETINGLTKMGDYAMYGIAVAYFMEKNSMIKEADERFKLIFDASEDVILLVSKVGEIVTINHSVSHNVKDILGKKVFDFQGPENSKKIKDALDIAVNQKRTGNFEVDVLIDGVTKYYAGKVSPVFNEKNEVNSAVMISRDITREKRAELDLIRLNANLEQKVAERTEELHTINKELESFTYSVSHDLRAPLRAINGFAEILKEESGDTLTEAAKDSLVEISTNANNMGSLIDDLLEFSRLGRQPVSRTLVNMNELFSTVVIETKRVYPQKVAIILNSVKPVYGDYAMLKQAALNLVLNAVKYSSKKEQPKVEIGSKEGSDHIEYYIKDNGAGFNMDYYDKLFKVFQRLHGVSEFEGTGVGLAIVQRIIEKHNGRVWAEAKEDEGATFYFSLPISN